MVYGPYFSWLASSQRCSAVPASAPTVLPLSCSGLVMASFFRVTKASWASTHGSEKSIMTRRSLLIHVFPAASHFLAWSPGASPAKGMFVITSCLPMRLATSAWRSTSKPTSFPFSMKAKGGAVALTAARSSLPESAASAFAVPITSPVQAIAANKTRTCNRFILTPLLRVLSHRETKGASRLASTAYGGAFAFPCPLRGHSQGVGRPACWCLPWYLLVHYMKFIL